MGTALTKAVFPAPTPSYEWDPHWIWLTTSEQEVIPAFFVDKGAKYTVIFSHGNAEDLGGVIERVTKLSRNVEVNVFAYEYTGYGLSTGDAHEQAVYADVEAAFKYVKDIIGVPWEQIILYGWSLGSGPSVHLASKTAVRGVVLQSSFLSIYRVAIQTRVLLPGDMFPNLDNIGKVACPVFVMHGHDDDVTPFWHGQELAGKLRKECAYPPFFLENAGHDDMEEVAGEEFYTRFSNFLRWLDKEEISQELKERGDS